MAKKRIYWIEDLNDRSVEFEHTVTTSLRKVSTMFKSMIKEKNRPKSQRLVIIEYPNRIIKRER